MCCVFNVVEGWLFFFVCLFLLLVTMSIPDSYLFLAAIINIAFKSLRSTVSSNLQRMGK